MKNCKKCSQAKPLTEFYKDKRNSDGRRSYCKECLKGYAKKNYKYDKQKAKQYYQDNKERINEINKKYYYDNKNKFEQYRQDNKQKISEQKKQYYQDNIEYFKEKDKQYYQDNKEQKKEYNKQYYQNNKDNIREQKKQYMKTRLSNDSLFKLKNNISCLVRKSIKNQGYSKNSKTFEILGCSFEHLMNWLDFEKWNNEDCHIDHIIPVSLAKNEDEVLLLNHYTNLQVLSAEDNLKKGNRNVKFENLIKVVNNHPEPIKITKILNHSNINLL